MAVEGPFSVEFAEVFPYGVYATSGFKPVRDFSASKPDGRFAQSRDKASGVPLWQVDVINPDPTAHDKTVRVKVAAASEPVLPSPSVDAPFVPVEFVGLTVTPYINQAGRLAYALRATAVSARSDRSSAVHRTIAK